MTAGDDGENWVVIGPSHVELGLQVPTMVDNWSLMLMLNNLGISKFPGHILMYYFPCTYYYI